VSLGLYLADKNKGKFKDTFLTFSHKPELLHLKGNILDKAKQMVKSHWTMNTNLHAAFDKILQTAVEHNVPQEEMPGMLLILSDMQFDQCASYDDSAMQMIARKYAEAGYNVPNIVFWNINAHDNVPAKFNEKGVALVSGFSPAIVKGVLAADLDDFTPEAIMLKTIMSERYDY
jgi:type III secretion system FlhB-like substrate exporter